ncbi:MULTISPECIES: hypothetical protein [unclassified Photorhabdus]|uniref:hypothetical protein n=1 Tax=unclassified Photorhabdus TaxID=2620880 RepID=UPI000DCD2BCB|nr:MULTISPECIES: hypothetical protein [unclassified Photorhabdus]RAX01792.1 hypothetical protein CKY03_05070 [Photorhabdus sp. S9-53]RAX02449.1 hypothetical protein CKY05_04580 [Photorhabdus sp. S10-54]RAX05488.1 hypothetical protein CKY04_04575 [Photorhabdus sp. S8-52]
MPKNKHSENKNHLKNRAKELPIQSNHSINDDIDSAPLEIGLDLDTIMGNSSVSLDQIQDYEFWKENISEYYKWMVVVKGHLTQLDWTLKSMDSPESAGNNVAKNIGTTALQTLLSTGSSIAGGAIGGAIGSVIAPGVGTIAGSGIGALAGTGLNYLNDTAIGKLNKKLKVAHPYPKTRNMIIDINNYDKNPITKAIKKTFNKENLKVTAGSLLTSEIMKKLLPIKIPAYKLADLAISHHRALEGLSDDKTRHILDFTNSIREVLNESHSDAVAFMRENYGDNAMGLSGLSSKIMRKKLTLDTMVRTKNKIEIKINSINKQVLKLSSYNRNE